VWEEVREVGENSSVRAVSCMGVFLKAWSGFAGEHTAAVSLGEDSWLMIIALNRRYPQTRAKNHQALSREHAQSIPLSLQKV